jgi:hypothetical protein
MAHDHTTVTARPVIGTASAMIATVTLTVAVTVTAAAYVAVMSAVAAVPAASAAAMAARVRGCCGTREKEKGEEHRTVTHGDRFMRPRMNRE